MRKYARCDVGLRTWCGYRGHSSPVQNWYAVREHDKLVTIWQKKVFGSKGPLTGGRKRGRMKAPAKQRAKR